MIPMAKVYDLYGLRDHDLEAARAFVEHALDIELVPHESLFHCGDYYRLGNIGEEHFILQRNFDSFEGEWTEADCKEMGVLLYVNQAQRPERIEESLAEADKKGYISLLRREQIDSEGS